ncbi:hypothetical protein ACFW88_30160, partial [Streptomyces anandii]
GGPGRLAVFGPRGLSPPPPGRGAPRAGPPGAPVGGRTLLAAGLGGGIAAIGAASYTAGRRAGRSARGPLTRLTGGRI